MLPKPKFSGTQSNAESARRSDKSQVRASRNKYNLGVNAVKECPAGGQNEVISARTHARGKFDVEHAQNMRHICLLVAYRFPHLPST